LLLSWVGTGRFIFSHATTDEEWAEIIRRVAAACEDMRAGGWWWVPAGATTRTVRRAATGELVRATWQSWIRRARGRRPD
jgi:glutamate-1-semialdehyde 2,1-aminomutase